MEIIKKTTSKARVYFFNNYKKGDKINVKRTALSLGISRRTLYNWINIINEDKA